MKVLGRPSMKGGLGKTILAIISRFARWPPIG
jgi:hypothetical protein